LLLFYVQLGAYRTGDVKCGLNAGNSQYSANNSLYSKRRKIAV